MAVRDRKAPAAGRRLPATAATAAPVDADGQPVDDPARTIAVELLRKKRDELRQRLDDTEVDEMVALQAEVTALQTIAARAGAVLPPKHMAEGVREELERVGVSTDPATGRTLTRADLPK